MEIVSVTRYWPGVGLDVLRLLVEPSRYPWVAGTHDDDPDGDEIAVLREVDALGHETGRIAGIEVTGFLTFETWDALPYLPFRVRARDGEILSVEDFLRRTQRELRAQVAGAFRR